MKNRKQFILFLIIVLTVIFVCSNKKLQKDATSHAQINSALSLAMQEVTAQISPVFSETNQVIWPVTQKGDTWMQDYYGPIVIQQDKLCIAWDQEKVLFFTKENKPLSMIYFNTQLGRKIYLTEGLYYYSYMFATKYERRCFYQTKDSVFLAFTGRSQLSYTNSYLVKLSLSDQKISATWEILNSAFDSLYVQRDKLYYFYQMRDEQTQSVGCYLSILDLDCNLLKNTQYASTALSLTETSKRIVVVTSISNQGEQLIIKGFTADEQAIEVTVDLMQS